jgi:hypothetical protein
MHTAMSVDTCVRQFGEGFQCLFAGAAAGGAAVNGYLVPSDQGWPEDKALIAELSKLNGQVTRYVLHQLDADAERAEPPSVEEERALSDQMAALARSLQARADRREALGDQPLQIEGDHKALPRATEDN